VSQLLPLGDKEMLSGLFQRDSWCPCKLPTPLRAVCRLGQPLLMAVKRLFCKAEHVLDAAEDGKAGLTRREARTGYFYG